jgi:hypothetical protein
MGWAGKKVNVEAPQIEANTKAGQKDSGGDLNRTVYVVVGDICF